MPNNENSRKAAEKGAKWVTVNNRKTAGRTAEKTVETAVFWGVSAVLPAGFTVTHSAPFSALFRLFSMSGIWHLCRWPQRLQLCRVFLSCSFYQKNPRVRKIRVRNSGAGNGCANFMDTWKNAFFLQEKPCP